MIADWLSLSLPWSASVFWYVAASILHRYRFLSCSRPRLPLSFVVSFGDAFAFGTVVVAMVEVVCGRLDQHRT